MLMTPEIILIKNYELSIVIIMCRTLPTTSLKLQGVEILQTTVTVKYTILSN
jgi:hypothetical protein